MGQDLVRLVAVMRLEAYGEVHVEPGALLGTHLPGNVTLSPEEDSRAIIAVVEESGGDTLPVPLLLTLPASDTSETRVVRQMYGP